MAVGLGCSQLTRITQWVGVHHAPPPRTKFPSGASPLGCREATAAGPGIVGLSRRGPSTAEIRKNGRSRVAQGRIYPLVAALWMIVMECEIACYGELKPMLNWQCMAFRVAGTIRMIGCSLGSNGQLSGLGGASWPLRSHSYGVGVCRRTRLLRSEY